MVIMLTYAADGGGMGAESGIFGGLFAAGGRVQTAAQPPQPVPAQDRVLAGATSTPTSRNTSTSLSLEH